MNPHRLALVLVPLALLLTACGATGTGDKGYVSGSGIITRLPADERSAPTSAVAGTTLDGKKWSLADQTGKVVVLNVWGTWCPPCRKEAPLLVDAANQLQKKDVVFIGINTRDSDEAQGLAFERSFDVPYPSIFDPDGSTLLAFRGTLTPNAIPSTLVIDAKGRVAASVLGEIPTAATLVGLVEDVLDG